MAEALVRGILGAGILSSGEICVSDPAAERRELFAREFTLPVERDNSIAVQGSAQVILAVKPQVLAAALADVGSDAWAGKLVVSIMAGVTTSRLEQLLPGAVVIRVMPNTPALVGEGISVISPGSRAGRADLAAARRLLEPVGKVLELPESEMDAVTALSGSGPAYYFAFTECLAAAGAAAGLSPESAAFLARETFLGAAALLRESGADPTALREKVTSPGGTTAAALGIFRERDLADLVTAALRAARDRSRELGREESGDGTA